MARYRIPYTYIKVNIYPKNILPQILFLERLLIGYLSVLWGYIKQRIITSLYDGCVFTEDSNHDPEFPVNFFYLCWICPVLSTVPSMILSRFFPLPVMSFSEHSSLQFPLEYGTPKPVMCGVTWVAAKGKGGMLLQKLFHYKVIEHNVVATQI